MARILTIHAAENALTVQNEKFNLHRLRWTRLRRIPPHPPFKFEFDGQHAQHYLESLFGPVTRIGKGRSGMTFITRVTPGVLHSMNSVFREMLSHVIVQQLPKGGTTVLLKLVNLTKGPSFKAAIAHHKRETEAHVHLSKHRPVTVREHGSCHHILRPGDYVPQFFAFGIDIEYGVALTCMQYIQGVPLSRVALTPKIFMKVQEAMCALWVSCIDHNDAHFDNMLVTKDGKVYIIDFEFCTRIPASKQRQFIKFLGMPGGVTSLDTAAQVYFSRHANAVQFQRTNGKMKFYNPGYKALRVLWSRLPPHEQTKILKKYGDKSFACVLETP